VVRATQRACNTARRRESPRPEGSAPAEGPCGVAALARASSPGCALRLAWAFSRGRRGAGFLPPTLLGPSRRSGRIRVDATSSAFPNCRRSFPPAAATTFPIRSAVGVARAEELRRIPSSAANSGRDHVEAVLRVPVGRTPDGRSDVPLHRRQGRLRRPGSARLRRVPVLHLRAAASRVRRDPLSRCDTGPGPAHCRAPGTLAGEWRGCTNRKLARRETTGRSIGTWVEFLSVRGHGRRRRPRHAVQSRSAGAAGGSTAPPVGGTRCAAAAAAASSAAGARRSRTR